MGYLVRLVFIIGAVALFAACGASQQPIVAPGVVPQSRAINTHAQRGGSWMRPSTSGQGLVYVTDGSANVHVFTYPQLQPVGTLTGFIEALGECVDAKGDVFIVAGANQSLTSSTIYEYAHGGATPIATLNDPAAGGGCAVDPTTGNLAVANTADTNNPYGDYGDVALYPDAAGDPTMYYGSGFYFDLCGYDAKGNLYLSATNGQYGNQDQLLRLGANQSNFEQISLDVKLYTQSFFPPSVQWDGKHITVSSASSPPDGPVSVYRLRISGANATVIGTAALSSKNNHTKTGQLWIEGKTIAGITYHKGAELSVWRYPLGGKPYHLARLSHQVPFGVAVSVEPSR